MAHWLALLLLTAPAGAPTRTKVAVMDVRSVQGVPEGTATILTDIVASDVARAGYDVISRRDITDMLGFEKQRQALGCAEETSCLAELGGALGVEYLLSGQVGLIGSQYRVSLVLVDAKRARTAARAAEFCEMNEDALVKSARASVAQLLAAIAPAALSPRAPAPAAPATAAPRHSTTTWIAFGTSGALLVGGAVMGLKAKGDYDDLKKQQGQAGFAAAWESKHKTIKNEALAADLLFVGAALAAGAGTWLWLDDGRVAVAPSLTPDGLGLAVAGRF